MRFRNSRGISADRRRGYVAIIASVIIATIVGVVALVFSSSNFLGRYDTLAVEKKSVSRALAEGCVEYAKLRLAQNPAYAGGETVGIASSSCRVVGVTAGGETFTITATAEAAARVTNLVVTVAKSDLTPVAREERPSP